MFGTFTIKIANEKIKIEFDYSAKGKPTITSTKLNKGLVDVIVVSGPSVQDLKAIATLQIIEIPPQP